MTIEELVKMPAPEFLRADGSYAYTHAQMANMRYQVAAAVAKRCADLCAATGQIAADMYGDGAECISTADLCADAIRREFGEES